MPHIKEIWSKSPKKYGKLLLASGTIITESSPRNHGVLAMRSIKILTWGRSGSLFVLLIRKNLVNNPWIVDRKVEFNYNHRYMRWPQCRWIHFDKPFILSVYKSLVYDHQPRDIFSRALEHLRNPIRPFKFSTFTIYVHHTHRETQARAHTVTHHNFRCLVVIHMLFVEI